MESSGVSGGRAVARYLLSMIGSWIVTAVVMFVLPFGDYSSATPGRAVGVVVFFTTFFLLMAGDDLLDYRRQSRDETTE